MSEARAAQQRALLEGGAFDRVWSRARQVVERDPAGWGAGKLSLGEPSVAEREAVDRLLGRSSGGSRLVVPLAALDEALRSGPLALSLPAWLALIGGPLRDRPARAARREASLAEAEARADRSRHAGEPWFVTWRERVRQVGQLVALEGLGQLDRWHRALDVLDALPAGGEHRAVLASRCAGDPKALDGSAPATLATLVLGAWALREGVEAPVDAEAVRALWARAGVGSDALASQVLVLNLRPSGESALACWLRAAAEVGHAVVLTLADLERFPLELSHPVVYVCENPAVLHAAAKRWGPACAPMVCTNGRPHAACWRVLEALPAGAVRYHGDFDLAGTQIAAELLSRTGGAPWRMSEADYRAAAVAGGPKLEGAERVRTPWAPGLADAMRELGVVVFEEQVVVGLVEDARLLC